MKVKVRVLGPVKQYSTGRIPPDGILIVREGTTVDQLVRDLGVPQHIPATVLVNKRDKTNSVTPLKDGDEVIIFSLIAGG